MCRHTPPYYDDVTINLRGEAIMTTTKTIQTADHGTTGKNDNNNKIMGEGTMNHENDNINMVTRISNVFGKDNISKLITGAAVGLALTMSVAMPGGASADSPLVSINTNSTGHVFDMDPLERSNLVSGTGFPAVDEYASLIYSGKLVKSTGFPVVDEYASLIYSGKLVKSTEFPAVDEYASLIHSGKLVNGTEFSAVDEWASLINSGNLVNSIEFPGVDEWASMN